jgi:hypothetical protein
LIENIRKAKRENHYSQDIPSSILVMPSYVFSDVGASPAPTTKNQAITNQNYKKLNFNNIF